MSNPIFNLYKTSIGKKIIMGVSGFVWFGFLVGHLYSNLHLYAGPESMNAYYAGLKSSPLLFWGVRAVLLATIVVHIVIAYQLVKMSWSARERGYQRYRCAATTYAARTMRWSGPILFFYIVYHLLHLTVGVAMPGPTPHDEYDVYSNVVRSFSYWYVSAAYIVAMLALGLHLYHGVWSFFQTIGANHPKYNPLRRAFATLVTVAIIGGYVSMPIAVLAGLLK